MKYAPGTRFVVGRQRSKAVLKPRTIAENFILLHIYNLSHIVTREGKFHYHFTDETGGDSNIVTFNSPAEADALIDRLANLVV